MADNSAFNTKMKLLAFFLIVSLLPLILLSIASSVIIKDYEKNLSLNNDLDIAYVTAQHFSKYVQGIKNGVSEAVLSDTVKSSIKYKNESAAGYLQGLAAAYPSVKSIIVTDSEWNILPWSVNYNETDYPQITVESIDDNIKRSGGFSDLIEYASMDGSSHVFTYSKNVIDEGVTIGSITVVMDFSYIVSSVNSNGINGFSQIMICDWNGNLYVSEKSGVKKYDAVSEFSNMGDVFEDIASGKLEAAHEYKFASNDKALQASVIAGTKNSAGKYWSVVSVTGVGSIASRYKDLTSSIQSSIFAISVVDLVLIFIFISLFLRPIKNAMRILKVNEINVSSQRVLVNGTTELDQLNVQVNAILDMLSESEQRYRNIVDMTDNIIFEYSVKKDSFKFSDNYNKKFSYRARSEKYEDSFFVNASVYPDDADAYKTFVTASADGQSVQGEFRFKTIYNDYAWYLVRSASIRDSYNSIIKIVGVMINIDKTKSREQSLMNKASLDPLTQAYNRESFELSLLNEFELSEMRKGKDAVLFIDLDDFKHFNDEYNHAVGDEVLVYTVETAKKLVDKNGFVGRFGGDEFVICYRETEEMDASVLAQRIISSLSSGFESASNSQHIVMCCSIGIAYITPEDSDPSAVIDRADQAMYSVKKSGKSNYAIYKDVSSL